MNILLLEPPAVSKFGNQRIFGGNGSNKSVARKPPLDLMMISGYLRKRGYDNCLVDANASMRTIEDVSKLFGETDLDVVFFSTSTCTIYQDLVVAKAVKNVRPSCVTVAIGTHVMALPEETFQECKYLDVIIQSSAWEQTSLNIVENLSTLINAKGICFRDADGSIVRTEMQPLMEDLDALGFPSHDKLIPELYHDPMTRRSPKTMVMGQRACISNCSFCCQPAFFGAPQLKKRSVSHVIEELKWVQDLGFKEVMFNDATLTADSDWADELFQRMIDEGIDLSWNCSTRATSIAQDSVTLSLMKLAGCHTIMIGLESANRTVLKNIRKNVTPEDVRTATELIRNAKMDVVVFAVIGFPGETRESIHETISFLRSVDATYVTCGIAVPVPGTDFFDFVEKHDYLLTRDWSEFDPMKRPVFSYPHLTAEDIAHYARQALMQFYMRPKYIIPKLASIRSSSELISIARNFFGFLRRYVMPRQTDE